MTHFAIEAAARAMCIADNGPLWEATPDNEKEVMLGQAMAAIFAFLDAVQKPSPGMVDAAYHEASMQGYWQAALRAEVAGEP